MPPTTPSQDHSLVLTLLRATLANGVATLLLAAVVMWLVWPVLALH